MNVLRKLSVGLVAALFLIAVPALALTTTNETQQTASGPTIPPDPWEGRAGQQAASGPTIPPDPWEGRAGQSHAGLWLLIAGAGMIAGTVSLAYLTPGSGTTPATAAQAKAQQIQIVEVTFADADTTAPIVTNLGIGTTGASPNTAQDLPKVTHCYKTAGTSNPGLSVAWTDGNTVTVGKINTSVGTGCVVVVYIEKPHSIVGPK